MAYPTWALILLPCICLSTGAAHADEKADAEKQFRAGVSLQKLEDFEAAIQAFESSLRLFRTKAALFNLANCQRATHRYPEALRTFEQLQTEFGSELKEPMLGQVAVQVAELKNLTGRVVIEVSQAGARISVDGKELGTSPLAGPVRLGLGDHELLVELAGFTPERINFNLGPQAELTEKVALVALVPETPDQPANVPPPPAPTAQGPAVSEPVPPTPTPAPSESSAVSTAGIVTGAAGLVLLAGGAVTGIWTLAIDSSLESDCQGGHCPPERASDIDRMNSLATATNVLLAVGGIASLGGALMWWLDQPDGASAPRDTALDLYLGPGRVSGSFTHRF